MKNNIKIDLLGIICPYCVMNIAKNALNLKPGESVTFIVDDPLAHKAVTEELSEIEYLDFQIEKKQNSWQIRIENRKET